MLNVGDPAPDFALQDDSGAVRTLQEFAGRKVVLWFYPKASTPGCTLEGCGFRDRAPLFDGAGAVILGASFDTPEQNRAFKQNRGFTYALLSDPERTLGLAYHACTSKSAKYPDRITYVIDERGRIERAYPQVSVHSHPDDVLRDLGVDPPKRGLLARLFGKR